MLEIHKGWGDGLGRHSQARSRGKAGKPPKTKARQPVSNDVLRWKAGHLWGTWACALKNKGYFKQWKVQSSFPTKPSVLWGALQASAHSLLLWNARRAWAVHILNGNLTDIAWCCLCLYLPRLPASHINYKCFYNLPGSPNPHTALRGEEQMISTDKLIHGLNFWLIWTLKLEAMYENGNAVKTFWLNNLRITFF